MKRWYALKVTAGKDGEVEDALREMGLKALAPHYQLRERTQGVWREKTKYLLEGYVLLRAEMTAALWYQLREMWYVLYVVPGHVQDDEVAYIQNYLVLAETSEIDYTSQIVTYRGGIACDSSRICKVDKRKSRALIKFQLNETTIKRWLPVKIIR